MSDRDARPGAGILACRMLAGPSFLPVPNVRV